MQYFKIETIKQAINALEKVKANWLIPAFVFAANDVGTDSLVDMSANKGTDAFLDEYFNGRLIGLPDFPSGNNLMRPRLHGIKWQAPDEPSDYVVRQDTKMWGNLFSSRGYREMRLKGEIAGEKTIVKLTDSFQTSFEREIPETFEFEDFLIWLFAFRGFPDEVTSWGDLLDHLLSQHLGLEKFQDPYSNRFKLSMERAWPDTKKVRPTDEDFQRELAPRLIASLSSGEALTEPRAEPNPYRIDSDDPVLATILSAIQKEQSHSFLLAGPPGTGKTRYAHKIAHYLTAGRKSHVLFLQFHAGLGYDDFVEGFRPTGGTAGGATYTLERRHLLKFSEAAASDRDNNYVIVIDELNRGDVARIFGELLTYLELDYRDREFTLSISGDRFSLPRNLIVIATANPFDRSVTDLDDALLRRFVVIPLLPDRAILEKVLQDAEVPKPVRTRTLRLFEILNDTFPYGFGHTHFMHVRDMEDLNDVWSGRVLLGFQRTLMHDRTRLKELTRQIDQLLLVDQDDLE